MQLFKIQSRKMLNATLCHVLVPMDMSYWAWTTSINKHNRVDAVHMMHCT